MLQAQQRRLAVAQARGHDLQRIGGARLVAEPAQVGQQRGGQNGVAVEAGETAAAGFLLDTLEGADLPEGGVVEVTHDNNGGQTSARTVTLCDGVGAGCGA